MVAHGSVVPGMVFAGKMYCAILVQTMVYKSEVMCSPVWGARSQVLFDGNWLL